MRSSCETLPDGLLAVHVACVSRVAAVGLVVCFGTVVSRRAFEMDGVRRKGTISGCFLVLLSTAQPHEGLPGGQDPPDSSPVHIRCLAWYLYYVFGQWDHPTPSSPTAWSRKGRFGGKYGSVEAEKKMGGPPERPLGPFSPSIISVRWIWAISYWDWPKLSSGTGTI